MKERKFLCKHCGKEHTVKVRDDYTGDFMTICPETGEGVYVVIE